MSYLINLTPSEEAIISAAAVQIGLAPEAFAEQLVRKHLPNVTPSENEIDAKLRQWQEQDDIKLMPSRTAAEIFAQWDEEAAQMTDKEREAEDQFWEDFQKGVNETRAALGMRQL